MFRPGWLKFAIQGSTYARALGNAAQRSGGRVAPQLLGNIAAQPRAQLLPGLADKARAPGALAPTPHQQGLQTALHPVPFAGEEQAGYAPHAQPAFERALTQRPASSFGMLSHGGQLENTVPTSRAITDRFGHPEPAYGTSTGGPGTRNDNTAAGGAATSVTPRAPSNVLAPEQLQRSQEGTRVLQPAAGPVASPNRFPRARFVAEKAGAALPTALGLAAPLALGAGILATKPGIRADLADRFGAPGDIHQKDVAQAIPEVVQGQATRAAQALAERGINPSGLRIAVDAPSGAGKTVLSKALAAQMGLRHHGLDWRPNLRFHQMMGGGDIEKTPYAPHAGEILEHQQLLRSYDPELFDVAIHLYKDPETIKQQVLKRGRGARTHDLLDYDKSIAVGRKAFETLDGDAIDLGNGTMMKIRPQQGWGNQLDRQLAQLGIDPTGLTRHQKLLSLHSGQREQSGAGWTPYMKSPFTGGEMAAMGASVPLGLMAARALGRRPL